MGHKTQAVRADELTKALRSRRFLALPREEIERLYAAVEVLTLDLDEANSDAFRPLVTYTAIHHNYRWFTYRRESSSGRAPDGCRRMGICGDVYAENAAALFLDDDLQAEALRNLAEKVAFSGSCDLRLSGLLHDDFCPSGRRCLAFVYMARLSAPGVETVDQSLVQPRILGMGDLQQERDQFDLWSQILIDNLQAF